MLSPSSAGVLTRHEQWRNPHPAHQKSSERTSNKKMLKIGRARQDGCSTIKKKAPRKSRYTLALREVEAKLALSTAARARTGDINSVGEVESSSEQQQRQLYFVLKVNQLHCFTSAAAGPASAGRVKQCQSGAEEMYRWENIDFSFDRLEDLSTCALYLFQVVEDTRDGGRLDVEAVLRRSLAQQDQEQDQETTLLETRTSPKTKRRSKEELAGVAAEIYGQRTVGHQIKQQASPSRPSDEAAGREEGDAASIGRGAGVVSESVSSDAKGQDGPRHEDDLDQVEDDGDEDEESHDLYEHPPDEGEFVFRSRDKSLPRVLSEDEIKGFSSSSSSSSTSAALAAQKQRPQSRLPSRAENLADVQERIGGGGGDVAACTDRLAAQHATQAQESDANSSEEDGEDEDEESQNAAAAAAALISRLLQGADDDDDAGEMPEAKQNVDNATAVCRENENTDGEDDDPRAFLERYAAGGSFIQLATAGPEEQDQEDDTDSTKKSSDPEGTPSPSINDEILGGGGSFTGSDRQEGDALDVDSDELPGESESEDGACEEGGEDSGGSAACPEPSKSVSFEEDGDFQAESQDVLLAAASRSTSRTGLGATASAPHSHSQQETTEQRALADQSVTVSLDEQTVALYHDDEIDTDVDNSSSSSAAPSTLINNSKVLGSDPGSGADAGAGHDRGNAIRQSRLAPILSARELEDEEDAAQIEKQLQHGEQEEEEDSFDFGLPLGGGIGTGIDQARHGGEAPNENGNNSDHDSDDSAIGFDAFLQGGSHNAGPPSLSSRFCSSSTSSSSSRSRVSSSSSSAFDEKEQHQQDEEARTTEPLPSLLLRHVQEVPAGLLFEGTHNRELTSEDDEGGTTGTTSRRQQKNELPLSPSTKATTWQPRSPTSSVFGQKYQTLSPTTAGGKAKRGRPLGVFRVALPQDRRGVCELTRGAWVSYRQDPFDDETGGAGVVPMPTPVIRIVVSIAEEESATDAASSLGGGGAGAGGAGKKKNKKALSTSAAASSQRLLSDVDRLLSFVEEKTKPDAILGGLAEVGRSPSAASPSSIKNRQNSASTDGASTLGASKRSVLSSSRGDRGGGISVDGSRRLTATRASGTGDRDDAEAATSGTTKSARELDLEKRLEGLHPTAPGRTPDGRRSAKSKRGESLRAADPHPSTSTSSLLRLNKFLNKETKLDDIREWNGLLKKKIFVQNAEIEGLESLISAMEKEMIRASTRTLEKRRGTSSKRTTSPEATMNRNKKPSAYMTPKSGLMPINLREWPSIKADLRGHAMPGAVLDVLNLTADGKWALVKVSTRTSSGRGSSCTTSSGFVQVGSLQALPPNFELTGKIQQLQLSASTSTTGAAPAAAPGSSTAEADQLQLSAASVVLQDMFHEIDADGDKVVSKNEFYAAMKRLGVYGDFFYFALQHFKDNFDLPPGCGARDREDAGNKGAECWGHLPHTGRHLLCLSRMPDMERHPGVEGF